MAQRTVQPTVDPTLTAFAQRLRDRIGASRVLLFGSHARGEARIDSDYDLIVVAERFAQVDVPSRGIGLRKLFREVGGRGAMDLICLTPEEFERASHMITLVNAVLPEAIDLLPPDHEASSTDAEYVASAHRARS